MIALWCLMGAYLSAQSQQEGDTIRAKLAAVLQERRYISAAVMGFVNADGKQSALGSYFSEVSRDYLSKTKGLQLVERSQINQLEYEWDLSASGLIAEDHVIALGNLLSADVLILGTMTRVGRRIAITIRAVDTKTGVVVSAGSSELTGAKYLRMYNDILE